MKTKSILANGVAAMAIGISVLAHGADVRLDMANADGVYATILPEAADVGGLTNFYIGAAFGGKLYLRGADLGDWQEYLGGEIKPAITGATLSVKTGLVVTNDDLSTLDGVQLYVGYGKTQADLNKPGHLAMVYQQHGQKLQASCDLTSARWGTRARQDGDTLTLSSGGKCIAPPPANRPVCQYDQPAAPTGVSLEQIGTVEKFEVQGLESTVLPVDLNGTLARGLKRVFEGSVCEINAPVDTPISSGFGLDVCYDETSEANSFFSTSISSGFVKVNPPVTATAKMVFTSKIVADCFKAGAQIVSNALTHERWSRQDDGTYVKQAY